jgi:hypothetical protein
MAQKKTQKTKKAKKQTESGHIMTIPELRRAFEHVETFVEIHSQMPKKELVEAFQKEWRLTFKKEVDEESATAYVEHALAELPKKHPKHRRHYGGAMRGGAMRGGAMLEGAPILQDTRPGVYTVPGVNEHSYAQVPAYVDKGFQNPEQARGYDPVAGQTHYVTRTPAGLGSNQAGGKRQTKKQKQQRGGMAALNELGFKPIPSSSPPSTLQIVQSYANAAGVPPSPSASQGTVPYI